jgi:hypothetical protein
MTGIADLRERLPIWVVYRPTTSDFKGRWVARMHLPFPEPEATDTVLVGETLEGVRSQLPRGLVCIGRQPEDAPEIEEVWL